VGIYSNVTVPQFDGSAARAVITNAGSTIEFSKVGTLAALAIQDVVRAKFRRFQSCYEDGLARNRKLEGRVSVRFIIDESGAVRHVTNASSDLPDDDVIQCVLQAFRTLRFAPPVGGTVSVVYPIFLAPG
jgi:TonB family protein